MMSMGLFPKNRAAPVLVDLNAWIPFVVQVSSLPDHHFVNGYIISNVPISTALWIVHIAAPRLPWARI